LAQQPGARVVDRCDGPGIHVPTAVWWVWRVWREGAVWLVGRSISAVRRILVDLWDLVSIGVPGVGVVAGAGVMAAAIAGVWWASVVLALVVVVTAVFTWWPRRRIEALPATDGVRVLAANLWYWNPDMVTAGRSLLAVGADVVVVSELSTTAHEVLVEHYAHHEVLTFDGSTGHGVYSRFPLERLPDLQVGGISVPGQVVWVRVMAPVPFVLCGAHLPRPTVVAKASDGTARFAVCRDGVRRMAEIVAAMPDAVVAGDLNLSDRQPAYGDLVRGRLDAMRTVRAGNTFHATPWHAYWRLFAMRIDHLVVPAGWRVSDAKVVPISGSDHRGVCATIAPPR
jgi:endonuclease/exonuclease/phosphatase (EEP) superfamily protein YafD